MALPKPAPLTFDDIAQRLVRDLVKLIHSGTVTERRLAGMVGISQPHLHNVLNGVRKLTPTVADQFMKCLDWSVLDLVESAEAHALLDRRQAYLAHGREIPLVHFAVGVGFSFPGENCGEIIVPNSWLARAEIPLAASAGKDPAMEAVIETGDILLIDRSPNAGSPIHADALYVVSWQGESIARWVRFSSRGLYLVSSVDWAEPVRWTLVVTPASHRARVVEGKIIALARPLDGTFRRPAAPSASN